MRAPRLVSSLASMSYGEATLGTNLSLQGGTDKLWLLEHTPESARKHRAVLQAPKHPRP